ncbi:hypothetical protein [Halorussus sp. MSC15.2]|uniref:hypothetical protein n=1 Tax=Halorussus sp. MSC15.2 TaxID=2283638 RepID=UPI0013D6D117|nr:hypothetical protein [Halorussus sp. MSC15.2]NEU58977.1 hypothetical protein [Halorussus sp. MSC15.2]
MQTRRSVVGAVAVSLAGLAGCVNDLPTDDATGPDTETTTEVESDDVTDVAVVNERTERVEVTVRATTGGETVFDRTVTLDGGSNRRFDDPFENGTSYAVTATTDDGLSERYEWTPERRDNAGVRVLIEDDRVTFEDITA